MMRDNIEFIDRDYSVVNKDKKLSSNQIKTRQASFNSIKKAWTDFRLSLLNKKLDRLKNEAVTRKFVAGDDSRITESSARKMLSKTTAIARLEEKIKILSKEDVPADYVSNRAIKLRKKMMDNLTFNSGNAYSVGLDKIDEVFAVDENEQLNNFVSEPTEPVIDSSESNESSKDNISEVQEEQIGSDVPVVSPEVVEAVVNGIQDSNEGNLDANALSEIVDSKLNEVSVSEEQIESTSVDDIPVESSSDIASESISDNDIVSPIVDSVQYVQPSSMFSYDDGISFDNIASTSSNEFSSPESISDEDIRNDLVSTINDIDSAESSNTINSNDEEVEISSDAIRAEIESALERLKFSQNNSSNINFNKFNDDGTYKTRSSDVISSNDEIISADYDDVTNEHRNEFIPGTDVFKPRYRGIYESDEEYVEFLRRYYEAAFKDTVQKTRDRFKYTPMTQEEIMDARENIEYDKYEKIYADEWKKIKEQQDDKIVNSVFEVPTFKNIFHPANQVDMVELPETSVSNVSEEEQVREYPIVVPERMVPAVYQNDYVSDVEEVPEFVEDDEQEITFDYSDATERDVVRAFDSEKSIAGFKALSERARELQEKKKLTLQKQQAVQSEALKTEGIAKKVKQDGKRAQEIYNEKMRQLAEYTRLLEEQCSSIESETEVVSKSAESNMRYIEEQENKNKSIEKLSGEIDAIISGDVTVHKGRR